MRALWPSCGTAFHKDRECFPKGIRLPRCDAWKGIFQLDVILLPYFINLKVPFNLAILDWCAIIIIFFLDLRKKDTIINCKGLCTVGRIPIAEVCECDTCITMRQTICPWLRLWHWCGNAKRLATGHWLFSLTSPGQRAPHHHLPQNIIMLESPPTPQNSFSHPATLSSTNLYLSERPCSWM